MTGPKETVKDFMIPFTYYPSINQNDTLMQAVNLIYLQAKEKGYRWIAVLDDHGNLTGFLTLRIIFEVMGDRASKTGGLIGRLTDYRPGLFSAEGLKVLKNTPVKRCLRPLVDVFVEETDDPLEAAEIIINRRVAIVPVINEQDRVVGIIRPVDLLSFIDKLFDDTGVKPGPGRKIKANIFQSVNSFTPELAQGFA
ncbi:MAG: hypothetical protein VR69_09185 [Peptococcaceae bacterium BRH_c4b]|nr:MAG: hypothetical protein VR69_09185 [Peptococcaceae bacterium BRH_c4b]